MKSFVHYNLKLQSISLMDSPQFDPLNPISVITPYTVLNLPRIHTYTKWSTILAWLIFLHTLKPYKIFHEQTREYVKNGEGR